MATSDAGTVREYLDALPPERRKPLEAVRSELRRSLPKGYREVMQYGMISYVVPLDRFPDTYNGQPLAIASLAAQKHYFALYLNHLYADAAALDAFRGGFARAGKRLDMGKSCVRFKRVEDLPLEVVAESMSAFPPERFVAAYLHAYPGRRPAARRA
jgi:hypothetical protein